MRTKLRPITAHLHHRNKQMNARADGPHVRENTPDVVQGSDAKA